MNSGFLLKNKKEVDKNLVKKRKTNSSGHLWYCRHVWRYARYCGCLVTTKSLNG